MRTFAVLAILAIFAVAGAAAMPEEQYQKEFTKFMATHEKAYEHDEFFHRYSVFKRNLDRIAEHNTLESSFTMAMNEYGDLSWEEFYAQNIASGYQHVNREFIRSKNYADLEGRDVNDQSSSVDWRQKNAVTAVKNQGQCGSCWAFSTTGSTEGAHAIATGHLISLSEQQLVDCAGAEGNMGCNGGLMDNGFEYIIKNGGICTESSYPYQAQDGSCKTTCEKVVQISGYKDVPSQDENALMSAVDIGPVSIAIEADQSAFQFYSGGVFDAACGTQLDHGVLIVGYGTDAGKNYWIVKNSWGSSWGESGYIRMVRGQNECGLAMQPSYPTV